MNKLYRTICDICRTLITDSPTIEDRLKKVHICTNPACIEKYENIALSILDEAKDNLNSDYYWKKRKEIQDISIEKYMEYKESLKDEHGVPFSQEVLEVEFE
jgi:hypothetical protein